MQVKSVRFAEPLPLDVDHSMAEEEAQQAVVVKQPSCATCFTAWWGNWTKVGGPEQPSKPQLPRLDMDDLDDLRSDETHEKKFVIQFKATHIDNYGDVLTPAQLQPITKSMYGTLRFAYPLTRTSKHEPTHGTYTVLAMASPETYTAWVTQENWSDISSRLLGNYWQVILVSEVGIRYETAETALASLRMINPKARSGSE